MDEIEVIGAKSEQGFGSQNGSIYSLAATIRFHAEFHQIIV